MIGFSLVLPLAILFCPSNIIGASNTNTSFQYLEDWCNHHLKVNNDGTCSEAGTFTIPGNCTSYYECVKNENGTAVAHIKSCDTGFIYDIFGCVEEANQPLNSSCPQMSCNTNRSDFSLSDVTNISQAIPLHIEETMKSKENRTMPAPHIILLPVSTNETLVELTDKFISHLEHQKGMNGTVQVVLMTEDELKEESMNETQENSPAVNMTANFGENVTNVDIQSQELVILNKTNNNTSMSNGMDNEEVVPIVAQQFVEVQNEEKPKSNNSQIALQGDKSTPTPTVEQGVTTKKSDPMGDTTTRTMSLAQDDPVQNEVEHLEENRSFSKSSSSSSTSHSSSSHLQITSEFMSICVVYLFLKTFV